MSVVRTKSIEQSLSAERLPWSYSAGRIVSRSASSPL